LFPWAGLRSEARFRRDLNRQSRFRPGFEVQAVEPDQPAPPADNRATTSFRMPVAHRHGPHRAFRRRKPYCCRPDCRVSPRPKGLGDRSASLHAPRPYPPAACSWRATNQHSCGASVGARWSRAIGESQICRHTFGQHRIGQPGRAALAPTIRSPRRRRLPGTAADHHRVLSSTRDRRVRGRWPPSTGLLAAHTVVGHRPRHGHDRRRSPHRARRPPR
jgi:hypothetical protein